MSKKKMFFNNGVVFDPDYQAILDYGSSQAYTLPSGSQQIIQNDLVIDLKASGIWTKLDCFYMFVNDAGLDFSGINWVDPDNFEVTLMSNWVHITDVGVYKSASSTASSLQYNPSTDAINNATSDSSFGFKLGAQGGDTLGSSDNVIRIDDSTNFVSNTWGTNITVRINNATNWTWASATYGNPNATDQFTIFTLNSTTIEYFKNGVSTNTGTRSGVALPNATATLGETSGGATNIHELAFIGDGFSGTEALSFYNDFETYLAAI